MGLHRVHSEVLASKKFGKSSLSTASHFNKEGQLVIGRSFPVLDKRYTLSESIGQGTFSQIFKAKDGFTDKEVAIKIMKAGYNVLAVRERICLSYYAAKTRLGSRCFVQVLDSFLLEGDRLCLVAELYSATLLSFVEISTGHATVNAPVCCNGSAGVSGQILQPRVIRSGVLSAAAGVGGDAFRSLPVVSSSRGATSPDKPPSCAGWSAAEWDSLRRIALQLVSALCLLRADGIIHADIKPENCFVAAAGGIDVSPTASSGTESAQSPGLNQQQQYHRQHYSQPFDNQYERPRLTMQQLSGGAQWGVRLGDFGNAMHVCEVSRCYRGGDAAFDVQSLPYRAPEVLLGLPFGHAVDMWSLGVTLAELCVGRSLFSVRSRPQLYAAIVGLLGPLPAERFRGGVFSDLLDAHVDAVAAVDGPPLGYGAQLSRIRQLLVAGGTYSNASAHHHPPPGEVVHFLARLLCVDPDRRLTAPDALQHPFLASAVGVPRCLVGASGSGLMGGGVAGFRSQSAVTLRSSCRTTVITQTTRSLPSGATCLPPVPVSASLWAPPTTRGVQMAEAKESPPRLAGRAGRAGCGSPAVRVDDDDHGGDDDEWEQGDSDSASVAKKQVAPSDQKRGRDTGKADGQPDWLKPTEGYRYVSAWELSRRGGAAGSTQTAQMRRDETVIISVSDGINRDEEARRSAAGSAHISRQTDITAARMVAGPPTEHGTVFGRAPQQTMQHPQQRQNGRSREMQPVGRKRAVGAMLSPGSVGRAGRGSSRTDDAALDPLLLFSSPGSPTAAHLGRPPRREWGPQPQA